MNFLWCLLYFFYLSFIFVVTEENKAQARFDNYRIYLIEVETEEQVELFQDLEERGDSYLFFGHVRHANEKHLVLVAAHKIAEITDLLDIFKIKHEILVWNLQQLIDEQQKDVLPEDTAPEKYDWHHYFHLKTIYAWLEKLANDYDYVTLIDMGESFEGIPIKGVKLAKNESNTAVFIESGIHAREWIAPATATFILNELLTSTDPDIQEISSQFNWIIFPVVNPDGYKYSFKYNRMWRKNRRLFGSCRGVDLNRNYPFHWNETGSSGNPCASDYAGPSAGSEPEIQNLMNFITENVKRENIKAYISLHSFSQLIMYPYGYTEDKVRNYDDFKSIASKAAHKIKKTTGEEYKYGSVYEIIYPASGISQDWAYGIANISIAFTFELRSHINSGDGFILPANQILGTGKETLAAVTTILQESKKLGYYN